MPPRKRKDPAQPKLEDTVPGNPVTKKSKAGQLDKPEIQDGSREELFKRRQAAKTGGTYTEPPKQQDKPAEPKQEEAQPKAASTEAIKINRAPVLTLWVAVVAQREGHSRESGLTFGKSISGMLAQSKGRAIGVIQSKDEDEDAAESKAKQEESSGVQHVNVFGMSVKAVHKDGQLLATDKGSTPVKPSTVEGYLKRAFGDRLADAERALQTLAESFSKEDIGSQGYKLYEQFRPSVPQGQAGWGSKGLLELDRLHELQGTA